MHFTKTAESFGPYTKITLIESASRTALSIVPELGARPVALTVPFGAETWSVLESYADPAEFAHDDFAMGAFLAPFPNRVADGRYTFQGETYQLAITRTDEHHAIHGLLRQAPFAITGAESTPEHYRLELEHKSEGAPGYPFPFTAHVTYRLSSNAVSVATVLTNNADDPAPMGFGWHPYFTFGEPLATSHLMLPPLQQLPVDERLIPTGDPQPFSDFSSAAPIGERRFDDGFRFTGDERAITLTCPTHRRTLTVTCESAFDYLQLFTHPSATALSIEPMTCAADAFNNGLGLRIVRPGQSLRAQYHVLACVR